MRTQGDQPTFGPAPGPEEFDLDQLADYILVDTGDLGAGYVKKTDLFAPPPASPEDAIAGEGDVEVLDVVNTDLEVIGHWVSGETGGFVPLGEDLDAAVNAQQENGP